MDYVVEGDTDPFVSADEGDRVRITNAKVATDRDGLKRIEVSGVCDVEVLGAVDDEQSSVDAAAADGGETANEDAEQLKKRVLDALREDYGKNADVTVAALAGELKASPDAVERVFSKLATEDGVLEATDDGFRRL